MKSKNLSLLFILVLWMSITKAQQTNNGARAYRNFPLVVGLQFQSVGAPFKSFLSNFSNPGIRIGTEVSLTGRQKQNWAQGFTVGWNFNKNAGNSFTAFSQAIYRPNVFGNFLADFRFGLGITRSMPPTDAFKQVNGEWVNQGTAGKTMLAVPAGVSIGYNGYHSGSYFSPFFSYELMGALDYNHIVPVLPVSSFQLGTRFYFVPLSDRKSKNGSSL